jgi:hypothetical protein
LNERWVGLVTRDPLLYGDLASYFRERRIPTLSLLPGARIPERVAVVVTSAAELPEVTFPHTVVAEPGDLTTVGVAVREALRGGGGTRTLVLGVDPGPRPGFALLDDRRACLTQGTAEDPENVARLVRRLKEDFPRLPLTIRVGDGDPPSRARILNALAPLGCPVELVDEVRTTLPGRRQNDPLAAKAIAATPGRRVAGPATWRITRGAVANLQRISREASGGRLTISRALAASVLRGSLPLGEAIRLTERTRFGPDPSSRRTGSAGVPTPVVPAGDKL